MINFPTFLNNATVSDEITITIKKSAYYQSIDFDESTAKIG